MVNEVGSGRGSPNPAAARPPRREALLDDLAGLGFWAKIGHTIRPVGVVSPESVAAERIQRGLEVIMVSHTILIERLRELARNLWWTWQPNVISLFRDLDPA